MMGRPYRGGSHEGGGGGIVWWMVSRIQTLRRLEDARGSSVSKPKPSWSPYQEAFAIHEFHHATNPFTSEPKDTVEVDAKGS